MKTAVVIPARLGATRLPRKPLRDLAGEPLVVRVWRRVEKMGIADRVVVATDHVDVAAIARAAGADVVMSATAAMWHPELAQEIKERAHEL